MTYTELFRDFLKREGLMKTFVNSYNNNSFPNALGSKKPLKWTDDFLVKETSKERGRLGIEPYEFLMLATVIDFANAKEGFEFWGDVANRWHSYAISNFAKQLIDDPYTIV